MSTKTICILCGEMFNRKGMGRNKCYICKPYKPRKNYIEADGRKICNDCHQSLSIDNFYINPKTNKLKCICKNCLIKRGSKHNTSTKIDNKKKAIDYKGGKCERCGYDRYYGALDFHHKDPENKTDDISTLRNKNPDFESYKSELDKCMLLCSNCHKEVHNEIYQKTLVCGIK